MAFKINDLRKTYFRLPEQKRGLGEALPAPADGHLDPIRY
jgi:hypothetical protein